ncbi:agmatinase family protein [Novipirellula artificiosorum]|uniref:Formimidoylglutamase n=1 Tax=Novipirellula artificiosorum TaxID=2528016 RepID=A0A5C6DIN1_9BACT|nr:agmatinase family protein [Novipirellula artificiosorum]TWU37233.1 Formimidoylglutamase [Novipirellula artificiosorum]
MKQLSIAITLLAFAIVFAAVLPRAKQAFSTPVAAATSPEAPVAPSGGQADSTVVSDEKLGPDGALDAPWEDGDATSIPLNPKDPSFNAWKQMRDFSKDKREPGLINVQRFEGQAPWVGIPTFFHKPIALTPEDLKVGKVEVAIMGAELVGDQRARTWGPTEMRNPRTSEVYHNWGDWTVEDIHSGVNYLQEQVVCDYGDAPQEPFSLDRTSVEVRRMVREIAATELEGGKHTIPIVIGGGHALMYPDVAGVVDVYGKGNVGVVHFDAHADYAGVAFGHLLSHAIPVRKLIMEGLVPGKNFIQVGLRGPNSIDMDGIRWARSQGMRCHTMAEVEKRGWDAVLEDAIKEAKDGPEYLFISFDIDVLDPVYAPGTSTPEPAGMTIHDALRIVRRLCAETNVVGIEMVELRPDSDPGYITMLNCNAVLRQCLNGLAMRKKGHDSPHYLDPLTVDDGQE